MKQSLHSLSMHQRFLLVVILCTTLCLGVMTGCQSSHDTSTAFSSDSDETPAESISTSEENSESLSTSEENTDSSTDSSVEEPVEEFVEEYDPSQKAPDYIRDPYTTEFEIDSTLADGIREYCGLAPDTPLTQDWADTITEIAIWDIKITSLKGISHFPALEYLTISSSYCTDASETALLTNLRRIDISWSYITEIPDYSRCFQLTDLCFTACCIEDLSPLQKAPALQFVSLASNKIRSIAPIKKLRNLNFLDLSSNCITDFSSIQKNKALCSAVTMGCQYDYTLALQLEKHIDTLLPQIVNDKMSPLEKTARLYDYIINQAEYMEVSRPSYPFGYCVLMNGQGVCADYAEAFCILADKAGLECQLVSSDTHTWNAVRLDGRWYLFDTLWDDSNEQVSTESPWIYFGFSTAESFATPDHYYDTLRYSYAPRPMTGSEDFPSAIR